MQSCPSSIVWTLQTEDPCSARKPCGVPSLRVDSLQKHWSFLIHGFEENIYLQHSATDTFCCPHETEPEFKFGLHDFPDSPDFSLQLLLNLIDSCSSKCVHPAKNHQCRVNQGKRSCRRCVEPGTSETTRAT